MHVREVPCFHPAVWVLFPAGANPPPIAHRIAGAKCLLAADFRPRSPAVVEISAWLCWGEARVSRSAGYLYGIKGTFIAALFCSKTCSNIHTRLRFAIYMAFPITRHSSLAQIKRSLSGDPGRNLHSTLFVEHTSKQPRRRSGVVLRTILIALQQTTLHA